MSVVLNTAECRALIDAVMQADHVDIGYDGDVHRADVVKNQAYAKVLACDGRHFTQVQRIPDHKARELLRDSGRDWTGNRVRGAFALCHTCDWRGPSHVDTAELRPGFLWPSTPGGCDDLADVDARDHGTVIA